jgi:transglutaminase-like putative cysteine protease
MRLRVTHETAYRYGTPAARVIQNLKLTPRGHDGQFVVNWRIDVDRDCRLESLTDPFGNLGYSFTAEGPLDALTIHAEGEVETQDTQGIVRGQIEPLPSGVFLRDTPLTTADAAIRDLSNAAKADSDGTALGFLHALMDSIAARMRYDTEATDTGTTAAQALAAGSGVCQDFAHGFVAGARHLGVPARYVSGYLYQPDRPEGRPSGHAWAEAMVERLGWVGFDPAYATCPTESYIRLAVGLDYLDAAPVRGFRYGGSGESLAVRVAVTPAGRGR